MKALFLTHSFPRFATDPVGSFVLRLAVALRDLDVETRVLAPAAPGLKDREEFESITVSRFRYGPRALETLAYAGTMRDQVRSSLTGKVALAGLLGAGLGTVVGFGRKFRPDIIHAHWWFPSGLVGSWARGLVGAPLVTTLHGSDLRLAQQGGVARNLARGVFRKSARVTTVSRWLARGVEEVAPGTGAVVAPMPVVADLFRPGDTRASDRILFAGKLNQQKGFEPLLRAMAAMKSRARLDVVVGVGSDEPAARSLATSLGLADRITWHPLLPQAELAEMYRRATVLAVPSVDEGLGLVAVEALLCETPVVAFDSGGLPDIVIPDKTGLLIPPGRNDLLAAALDDILTRPDRGASLGKAGRSHALATFSPAAAAARYRDIYQAALRQ